MSELDARNERLRPGDLVDLFQIDLLPIGVNQQFYFQQADAKGGSVWFGGHEYLIRPIKVSGFSKSSQDSPPEPTLAIGNVDKGGYALLNQYGELLGGKLTRIQTYAEFLDKLPDGTVNPSANATMIHIPEIWYIEQKGPSSRQQITFRLKSLLDLNGKKIPARTILKLICRRPYRVWDPVAGAFAYSTAPGACPYTSATYFDRHGTVTDAAHDECSKDPQGCHLRGNVAGWGSLPGWFFPGVQRISTNG
jgi:lambda family phage minor tail protein L